MTRRGATKRKQLIGGISRGDFCGSLPAGNDIFSPAVPSVAQAYAATTRCRQQARGRSAFDAHSGNLRIPIALATGRRAVAYLAVVNSPRTSAYRNLAFYLTSCAVYGVCNSMLRGGNNHSRSRWHGWRAVVAGR